MAAVLAAAPGQRASQLALEDGRIRSVLARTVELASKVAGELGK